MKTLMQNLGEAARKRAAYRRTVAEISRMPLEMQIDLDIYAGDAHRLARRAVYGA